MIDLTKINEYKERLGKQSFYVFLDIIYGWLMELKPDKSLNLNTHPKITDRNRELVIELCKLFISEGNSGYELSNDYTQIKNKSHVPGKKKNSKNVEKQRKGVSVR